MRYYQLIRYEGELLRDVGVSDDGTVYNPHGYPEALVRAALQAFQERVRAAQERDQIRRRVAAARAVETRRRRRAARVYRIAQQLVAGGALGPLSACAICRRALSDDKSIARGIGSECWQDVLSAIEASRESESSDAAARRRS